jgi:hypothetical protein
MSNKTRQREPGRGVWCYIYQGIENHIGFDGSLELLKARIVIVKHALIFFTLSAMLGISAFDARPGENLRFAVQQAPGAPQCDIKGSGEITITCNYSPESHGSEQIAAPRIAVDHASLFFDTDQDSHMKIGLTITNHGSASVSEARTVYIAIDGADGKNFMRRALPSVDLSKVAPQQTAAFSETLLSPAFPRGTYTIHLWIPSSETSLKFDSSHDLLLDNIGVPDSATGLNTLAIFTVNGSAGRKKHPH